MQQKTMTEITPPKETKKEPTPLPAKPTPTKETKPEPKPTPPTPTAKPNMSNPPPPKPKEEYKEIPREMKILLDALEEFEGIAYAARNKIYQLYGPVSYQIQNSTKPRNIDDIQMSFPKDIEARLFFEDKGDWIRVAPKQFLGSENFAKIASAIRGMGGEYVSAGKDSHFKIRKF